ncbi:IclR family transcriptional regulator [Halomonas organivorans]|uniref:DNA-binding IclR family transcriptional regulator n=1 Tax=Halomonas organivorans TaxID=257772 RepID=A0A7W5BVF4_9GAMM|nr:IclR family transcriptional regulator [Halomonas organivorans]MBB3139872.1 DNA-binding IclR family transcriptional regulator [Halomonas organivorans]
MSSKTQSSEGRGVQSIETGSQLLEVLITRGEPMMLKELAAAAGIAPAQAHPYLVSLRNLGMVEQNRAGRYQMGPFALDLAVTRMRSVDPMQLAGEAVVDLSLETGLTALLSVWGAFGPTVVVVHEGEDQIHMNTKVGTVYSVTGTATGRTFAAYLPPEQTQPSMRSNLPKFFLEHCVGTPQPYDDKDIAQIRETRISAVPNPPVPGINAIASPVFDHLGQILAVITLVADARILDKSPTSAFAHTLVEATRSLSAELGYWDEERPHQIV